LIAGDAVITTDTDKAFDFVTKRQELARPPSPVTCDWPAARRSLMALAALRPYTLACGHGIPMSGPEIAGALQAFAEDFVAPLHGRYVPEPAVTDENGIVYLPPPAPTVCPKRPWALEPPPGRHGRVLFGRRPQTRSKHGSNNRTRPERGRNAPIG
jgi:hypothetical protein